MLHCHAWQKDHAILKFPCPEKITVLAVAHSGTWAMAGTPKGKLYVWEVSTGALIRSWDAHYKTVTAVRFAQDDSYVVSSSEDAVVQVWELAEILSPVGYHSTGNEFVVGGTAETHVMASGGATGLPTARHTWTEHTLPVTDIVCGYGLGPYTRIVTASRDRTCKVWDYGTGQLLTTLLFPNAICRVTVDPVETVLYAGTDTGVVWQVQLYRTQNNQHDTRFAPGTASLTSDMPWSAVGGDRRIVDITESFTDDSRTHWPMFHGHSEAITGLELSFDGTLLVTASRDGKCIVWDTHSRQQIKVLSHHKGAVSNLQLILRPPGLTGVLGLGVSGNETLKLPNIQPFKRITQDPYVNNGSLTGSTNATTMGDPALIPASGLESLRNNLGAVTEPLVTLPTQQAATHARQVLTELTSKNSQASLQANVAQLQSKLDRIQDHHAKLRGLNDELYQTTVTKFMDSFRDKYQN
ncbi:Pre-rRNA-processing protein ipi3 [Dispira parvispora]|uniref:Pre-rRNA-processing protein ipi3 n=1 Tax=Dispira parvispora TaxID=1520584 RepID=A0A9W8AKB8_9FUNG|nr:Pre-rRNA-processing protein ipi3 [Dispira parvispora]